jgi:uncharacterized protein (DUF58 family)
MNLAGSSAGSSIVRLFTFALHDPTIHKTERNGVIFALAAFLLTIIGASIAVASPLGFYLMLLPWVFLGICFAYLRSLRGQFKLLGRTHHAIAREGEQLSVKLELIYTGEVPFVKALVKDAFPANGGLESPELQLFSNPGEQRFALTYDVAVNRGYGDFTVGPLSVTLSDPFGLFHETEMLPGTTMLKVFLQSAVDENLDLSKENSLTPLGDTLSKKTGQSLEFFGLSEFRPGHDIRFVSWAKYAQTGILTVKEFEFDSHSDLLIVLNTEAAKVKGFGFGNNLKKAIRLVAGMLETASRAGIKTRLITALNGAPQLLSIPPVLAQLHFALDFIAHIPSSADVDFLTVLETGVRYATPSTVLLIVSHTLEFDIEPVLDQLFAAVGKRARVALHAIDDTGMIRFAYPTQKPLSPQELQARLGEYHIEFKMYKLKDLFREQAAA